jgi:chromosome segregation ATPase
MTLLHSQQRRLHNDLAGAQRKLIALKPAAEARLSDNLEFQAHLAEVTAERDQLKHRVSELAKAPRQRANRVALRNARQEIEELRFQLRMANRAILDLEVQLTEAKALASIDSTAPLPQYPDI